MTGETNPGRGAIPVVVSAFVEAYNRRDVEAMLDYVHDEVVFESHAGGVLVASVQGRTAFADLARHSAALYRARRQDVGPFIVGLDRVALAITFKATPAVDMPNGWRAGQRIELSGVSFYRLKDGLIIELADSS